MNLSAPAQRKQNESHLLDGLRSQYEARGFRFVVAPRSSDLPSFLGSYQPDAIAQKPGLNIAIEVKTAQSSNPGRLQEIRRIFDGHDDWQFNVFFAGADFTLLPEIELADPSDFEKRRNEIAELNSMGYRRAALLLSWSLLEARLHTINGEAKSRARSPSSIIQALAMDGYIDPDMERQMRPLIELRNRVAHGDLKTDPTAEDVRIMLGAIEQTLEHNE